MSQGSAFVPTTGTVSGLEMAQDMNGALSALLSSNSGTSAPANDESGLAVKGQVWLDASVSPNLLKQFDGTSWLILGALDLTNHIWAPPIGGGTDTIASATTTDIGAKPFGYLTISGTTTITSFGSSPVSGTMRALKFSGALTLTHHATSLILPGGANITTAGGDVALVVYLGSGNWKVLTYQPVSVSPQMAAYSFRGNNTDARANPTEVTILGLTTKSTPVAADMLMIADSADSNAWKKILGSAIAGLLSLGNGLKSPANVLQIDPLYVRGDISGLTLSTAGGSGTFGIAVGMAVDDAAAGLMLLSSAYTKNTNAWAVGSGNGALDASSIAVNTWYHVHLIKRVDTGVVDVLISLSATAPTLPANYTLSRRIGAMKTDGSSQWTAFTQVGDQFLWAAPVQDVNNISGTGARVLTTLTVPTGVIVSALFRAGIASSGVSIASTQFPALVQNDVAVSSANADLTCFNGNAAGAFSRLTDTSARIGVRSANTNSVNVYISTHGWIDARGK